MERAVNDATLQKAGDIFQYYIALRDCFNMNVGDKLQIETNGDVSIISELSKNSFQREVKHHFGKKNLADRDEDFWKTLSNWYLDYDRLTGFSNLILFTTASISTESPFYNWDNKETEDKLSTLLAIGKIQKENEKIFRKYYNKIFDEKLYEENKLIDILKRFTIESSQHQIAGVSSEFDQYIGYIPKPNRDNYVAALLGRILSIITQPPHQWEVTKEEFDLILQQEAPAYIDPNQRPLPTEFADMDIPEHNRQPLLEKHFVQEIRRIEYEKQIPNAISDYWKAEKTVIKYFRDDFLYLRSLDHYRKDLESKLKYEKDGKIIETEGMDRKSQIRNSKLMYTNVMRWEAKDFETIIRNQGYFQRGIIQNIVEDKKFNWDVGDDDEY